MKLTRKTFLCTDKILEMMGAIQKEIGAKTETAVFEASIVALYKSLSKYGKDLLTDDKSDDSEETLIKKAKIKIKTQELIKDEEENARLQPKIKICTSILGGEIEENENRHKFCRYTSYTLKEDQSQLIPLRQVDAVLAETSLFIPSREAVFKNRPEVAKKFKSLK